MFFRSLRRLTWICAFDCAGLFGGRAATLRENHIHDAALREAVACGLVFFAVLLIGAIFTYIAVQAVRDSRFSASDRTLGGGVGVLRAVIALALFVLVAGRLGAAEDSWRSEEHTSELQSLMCISYAVFCLKKKNKTHSDEKPSPHMLK